MINWLSQTGRKEEVTRAVQALSRFYKLTLSRRELMNTIGGELEHVSLYVQLQNMRYENCATLVIDVPEELCGYTIPKLTFQPLVENALLHGIRMTEKKTGSILITGWREGDDIVFMVSDDGAGIPPEKLDSLQEGAKKPEEQIPRRPEPKRATSASTTRICGSKACMAANTACPSTAIPAPAPKSQSACRRIGPCPKGYQTAPTPPPPPPKAGAAKPWRLPPHP